MAEQITSLRQELSRRLAEHIAEAIVVLLLLPLGTLVWATIPTLLAPLWLRSEPQMLQRILGLALLLVLALLAYAVILRYRLKTKLRVKFGVKWDRHTEPYCPTCDKPLSEYREKLSNLDPHFWCVTCKARIHMHDDHGARLSLLAAKDLLRLPLHRLVRKTSN